MKSDYVEQPRYESRLKMNQAKKYFAKNDLLLLGDLSNEENPQTDSFKKTHVALPKKKEVTEKAFTVNYFSNHKGITKSAS